MAQSPLPPNNPNEEDDRYNPGQNLYNAEFNEGKKENHDPYASAGIDQAEAFANDPQNAVRQRENIPFENTGKNRNAKSSPLSRSSNPITAINALKRGGPLGLIIAIIIGGGTLIGFGSFTLLPIHLYENFLNKYDSNQTSYTFRTNKMITNKINDRVTTGPLCDTVSITCRFKRPSNFMLKQLASSGVTALDKSGAVIEDKGIWPNSRTYKLTFTDSVGNQHEVLASGLKAALNNTKDPLNAQFSAALHQGLKTRLQTFSDSIFKTVASKFGFSKENTLADETSEDDANKKINADTSGEAEGTGTEGTGTGTGEEEESTSTDEIKDKLTSEIQDVNDKETGGSVGNLVGNIAGAACIAADIPGVVEDTGRAYQMAQLVRLGAEFLTVASAMKAGDATTTEVSTFGDDLTKQVNGKSALDSFGIKATLFNDTTPPKGSRYKNYIPGGGAEAYFDKLGAAVLTNKDLKNVRENICAVATNPLTGAAIDATGAADFGISDVINIVGGIVEQEAQNLAMQFVLPRLLDAIPPEVYADLAETVFGDITKDMVGENFGDALSSGAANTLGQLSNAGGNMPLSLADAVAYDGKTAEVNLANAQEDRATHSPLDASNENTFMGTLFNSLIPFYSQTGSLTGLLSSFSGIASTATAGVLMGNSYAATDDAAQYKLCNDPSLTNDSGDTVAAGPFCNIQYGIPPKYLDMDPQDIVNDLDTAGQIDDSTGEANDSAGAYTVADDRAAALGVNQGNQIESYSAWLKTCTDGTTEEAISCKITNGQIAEYALYTIDHRIQKDIDDEDTTPESGTTNDEDDVSDQIPNTCTNTRMTGAGIVDITTLNGSTLTKKLASAGTNGVALASSTYTFNDFAANSSGFTSSNSGLYGTNTASTIFEMTPQTSTKAGQIPGQDALSTTPNAHTNQFYLARLSGSGMKLNCFTVKGTNQGHLYNGVMLDHVSGAQVSNIKLDNAAPGNSNAPPGETFAWNDFHGNNNTYKNIEIDGNNDGAAGFGNNSSNGDTWINSYVHDQKYSAAWTLWQQTGGATFQNCIASNSHNAINLERVTGTIEVDNFTFDNNDHDFNLGNDQSGDLKVIIKDPIIKGRDKLIINIGTKMQGVANLDKRSDVKVLVNGVDKTSSMVTFTGGGS